jgi:UDPglucose--hexose-1-phosphate uridylyltransferase
MSERRYDPTTGEWVTFATHRQDRTYKPPDDLCPLCPTRDPSRPTEIPREHYEVAVFDNRFPSLSTDPPPPDLPGTELVPVEPAYGRCEVVVYSDDHHTTLAEAGRERIRLLVDVWADRWAVLGADPRVSYVLPFENKGEIIGVTLSHPHGQVYAYSDVPPRPLRELRAAQAHRERTGRCVECDVVAAEATDEARVVTRTDGVVAFVPQWARFPYEVHVVPLAHRTSVAALGAAERDEVAEVLAAVLAGYDALFGFSMPYVLGIHSRPTDDAEDWDPVSHVHWEIAPPYRSADKIKFVAGSEMMGGAYLTDVAPEAAAERMREAAARAGG